MMILEGMMIAKATMITKAKMIAKAMTNADADTGQMCCCCECGMGRWQRGRFDEKGEQIGYDQFMQLA